jgi:hypothetical protein
MRQREAIRVRLAFVAEGVIPRLRGLRPLAARRDLSCLDQSQISVPREGLNETDVALVIARRLYRLSQLFRGFNR